MDRSRAAGEAGAAVAPASAAFALGWEWEGPLANLAGHFCTRTRSLPLLFRGQLAIDVSQVHIILLGPPQPRSPPPCLSSRIPTHPAPSP